MKDKPIIRRCGRKRTVVTVGKKYNKLICLSNNVGLSAAKHVLGKYKCECGTILKIRNCYVVSNHTTSCGCVRYSALLSSNITHGLSKHPAFKIWNSMMERCYNKNNKRYADYGGRGILVCKRWRISVANFITDMGPRPDGMSIDRKNNNLGYRPSNCKWSTPIEQQRNRRGNRFITAFGKTATLSEWASDAGLYSSVISWRIKNGWPLKAALTKPPNRKVKYLEVQQ